MVDLEKAPVRSPEQGFGRIVGDLCRARFPYLYVQTWEEDRVLEELQRIAADEDLIRTPRVVHVWSLTNGLAPAGRRGTNDTRAPLKALEAIESSREPSLFVLRDIHVQFGAHGAADPQVVRKLRDMLPGLRESRVAQNVIFVAPRVVIPHELQKDVTIVDFDLPGEDELGETLRDIVSSNQGGRLVVELEPGDEETLTRAALGLTRQEAENAFARAMVRDGRLDLSSVEVIVEEKRQIIKKTEILEFITPQESFADVGGLENLKAWLTKRTAFWQDADAERWGLPAPKGILLTGVPGCGKSLTAKCVSGLWHLPLLRLDMGRIFSGIIGSSEQNMRDALRTAEAISPSVLWIDEIEKGFGGSSGATNDSGTSQRVFGTFLTWMQEKCKPVFVFATANAIAGLPPEFLRKGRFDEIFFVDLPTPPEREAIWRVHLGRRLISPEVRGGMTLDEGLIDELVGVSDGYSGAEIEQAVLAGLFDAYAERRPVRPTDFSRATKNMVPMSVTQSEEIRSTREWARVRAVPASSQHDRMGYMES